MTTSAQDTRPPRWIRTLRSPEGLGDDLGPIGETVGPRTGPNKRRQGDKEDYVLRRLLAAWRLRNRLPVPCEVRAEPENGRKGEPDFVIRLDDHEQIGIEVTEAGDQRYQQWLTHSENHREAGDAIEIPFEASTPRTVAELVHPIRRKIAAFDSGAYQTVSRCHLVVYDNTSWGGFLDKRELVEGVRATNDLGGRFATVNIVFCDRVVLDVLGIREHVDVSRAYEADYVGWLTDQVSRLRNNPRGELDTHNIAEELADLGKSERRALASHLRNLLVHLLKHAVQPERRTSSWTASIANTRAEIEELLSESPSLRSDFGEQLARQFRRARQQASQETGLPLTAFPETCPYRLEQIVDDEFFPDPI
jgi:Domain of unknown function DUF29